MYVHVVFYYLNTSNIWSDMRMSSLKGDRSILQSQCMWNLASEKKYPYQRGTSVFIVL